MTLLTSLAQTHKTRIRAYFRYQFGVTPVSLPIHTKKRWVPIAIVVVALGGLAYASEDIKRRFASEPMEFTAKIKRNRMTVTSLPRSRAMDVAEKIDVLAAESGIEFEPISDKVFLRRIYLDLAGRIPTSDEIENFEQLDPTTRRGDIVDQLLDSEAWVSHQFNFWADLLRLQSRNRIGPNQPYLEYVKEFIRSNRPFKKVVREMVTASGPLMKRGNGAVGYMLRDYGMPEDNMSNTIRIFLGSRLECAQCHDHPTDHWTQRQYFEMVAFFGGIQHFIPHTESGYADEIEEMLKDPELSVDMKRYLRQINVPLTYGISGTGTGVSRLPESYQNPDGDGFEMVNAKSMFGDKELVNTTIPEDADEPYKGMIPQLNRHHIPGTRHIRSRIEFADWLTSSENRRFQVVIVNRMWQRIFGAGIVEPVDNVIDKQMEQLPEELNVLADWFVECNYDMKQLVRSICLSQTYQNTSTIRDTEENLPTRQPIMRRLSAEQIWDSLLTLTIEDVDRSGYPLDAIPNFLDKTDIHDTYDSLVTMTPSELKELVAKWIKRREEDWENTPKNVFRMDARPAIYRQDQIYAELEGDELLRASELLSPMPPGHFLREFGQSAREQINHANTDISTTQLLGMMNGYVEKFILGESESKLGLEIQQAATTDAKLDVAFEAVLGRAPRDSEKEMWLAEFEKHPGEAAMDLAWTLINSTEFLFVR